MSTPSLARRHSASILCSGLLALSSFFLAADPASAQNRLSISTSLLDAPGSTVPSGADFRYRVSYSCDLVSIPSCDNAQVTVDLPPEVEFRGLFFPPLDVASGNHDGSPTGGTVTFDFQASVPAGNTGDLEITVRFPNGSTPDGTTTTGNTDAATASGTGLVDQMADLPPVTATASPQVDLSVHLVDGFLDDCPSMPSYQVRIGPDTSNGSLDFIDVVQLVLTLPTGVSNVSPNDGGVYDALANTVTWSGLGTVTVPNTLNVSVDLTFSSPPFSDGQTVSSFAEATVNALGEPSSTTVGPLPFDHAVQQFVENPSASVSKIFGEGRPSGLPPAEGQPFTYRVSIANDGNMDLDSLVVTDDGDGAGAEIDAGLTITGVSTGAYTAGYTGLVTISYTTNLAPAAILGSSPGNSDLSFPIPPLSPGERVTSIEWSFAGPIPVGMSPMTPAEVAGFVNAGFPAGTTIDNHVTADWTATLTGLCGGPAGPASGSDAGSFDFDVNDPYTYLRPRKNEVTTGPYFPGDTVGFSFQITNDILANDPAVDPVVVDLLPEFLTFQPGTETYADNGTGVVLAAPGDFEVIPNYNGTGRTLLRWSLTGALDPGETVDITFETVLELGVIFGSLRNRVGMSFEDPPTQQICAGGSITDAADLDGDLDTADELCIDNENIAIAAVAQLSSTKLVQGQCDPGFIPGLGTGTSLPGGVVDWRVRVQNIQTVPMENFVIVDILPFVGDTGVRDLTPRLSLFRPILTAPISPPPGGAVFYSTSGNPCRPEVGGPTSGCDPPNWTTVAPAPITDVQAIKIEFGARVVHPLDVLQFSWPMVLPADAPIDGSEAFNSFAFGATRQDDGGFLAAEPNKVGIDATCLPAPPDDAMLGDFVWIDSDGSGTQDPGEPGINGVPVELYDPGPDGLPRTADDVLLLRSITADDSGGNPGWYKFSALSPGDYYVLFDPPLNFEVTTQDVPGDETIDSDADPQTACTDVVTLGPSETDLDVDLGLLPPVTASLGDYVWFDLDGDGVQNEALDRGLNGTTVRLFADDGDGNPEPFGDDGTPLEVTVTADDPFGNPGYYLFTELIPGVPYFVQFVEPSPATGFTTRNAGGNDTVDSDARSSDGTSQVVTLAPGEHDPTIDAGVVLATGTLAIGNVVWCDDDGNGMIDAPTDDDGLYDPLLPEAGVNGVRLNLYLDINGDGRPQVDEFVATTRTQTLAGKDGRYRFGNLPAGEYIAEVDPSAFAAGAPLEGKISTSFTTVDPDDDLDDDDSGAPLATSVVSGVLTLSENAEPTPDSDDDLEDDDNINFTLDFGFVPGPSPSFDFGDNPDAGAGAAQGNYQTVSFDGGALHPLLGPPGPYLGTCVDADNGQQQNNLANADDVGGAAGPTVGVCASPADDEDGVAFSATLLAIGGSVDITLSSSSPATCRVNGWIDWNRNGSFEPAEQVASDVAVAGTVPLVGVPVPATAVPGVTYARFRCSSAGGDGPIGPAADGEVEDYRLQVMGADWGDAPDVPYGTLMASGGPLHETDPNVEMYLGNCVDTESDGRPMVFADGDDAHLGDSRIGDCVDDEDGVRFDTMLVRGANTQITVTASMAGRLDGWVDLDGVGGFAGADQVIVDQPVVAGANVFNFLVPPNAAVGLRYARFRYSSAGGLAPGGMAADGEVEDYAVVIKGFDFGDAPDPEYPTVLASGGAQHVVDPASNVYLGVCADPDDDGAPSPGADGDDLTPGLVTGAEAGLCDTPDDESGVTFDTMLITCQQARITVSAAGAGRLDAWIDYDRSAGNGFGGSSDQIVTNRLLSAGSNVITFDVPCGAQLGNSYARFRYSSAGNLAPGGLAMDGEVEDYPVFIKGVDFGDAADTHGTTFGVGGPNHGVDPNDPTPLHLGACVDTEVNAGAPLDTSGDDVSAGTSTVGTCAVANDDEDGVAFPGMLIACGTAAVDVTASTVGVLDAWIDFDGDGTFTQAGNRIFNGRAVVAGVNNLTFSVPCDADPGNVSARFRLSSTGVGAPTGPAMDGEVEDYTVFLKGSDLGDAPDTYGTTNGAGGPTHGVDPNAPDLFLGTCVDTEGDAGVPLDGTGDDSSAGTGTDGTCTVAGDDEDGVTFDTMLFACQDAGLTVTTSAAGRLDAWIDFGGDGSFAEAGDRIAADQALAAGGNSLTVAVPCDAVPGNTYARFRFSSTGGLGIGGFSMDGEVEDYAVLLKGSDLGDAPDTYGTTFGNGGPVHGVDPASTLYLGTCVDTESDAQPPLDATGDDTSIGSSTTGTCAVAGDDEDGVTFDTMLISCQDTDLTVTAGAAGVLDAWIDFGGDGNFAEPGDRIFSGQALVAGANSLAVSVPCDASLGTSYARFRLSSTGVATSGGVTMDGEVEDYAVLLKGSDFGDAPDTYGTTFGNDGPRHGIDPGTSLVLGACVDTETDAETPLDATGDDGATGGSTEGTCATAGDDEDGVAFDTMLITCQDADLTVTAGAAGVLDAWIDFGGDGNFAEAGDRIFNSQAVSAGANGLTFSVPCAATLGATYARFRLSSTGASTPTGPVMDGEVEDYEVLLKGSDFGDAPDSYGTTDAASGPVHGVDLTAGFHLGACVDTEIDAGAPLDATGDDVTAGTSTAGSCAVANDDEDGVSFDSPIVACGTADLTINASQPGVLDAWIDFDADGTFDPGDQIFAAEALAAGDNARTFPVPCTAAPGGSYARFRFSSTGVAGPNGPVMDGEVEDYAVELRGVDFGDNPDTYSTTFGSSGPYHPVDPAAGLFLGSCVDTETDAEAPLDATGDDGAVGTSTSGICSGSDDEDGVSFDSLITACKLADITVTASAPGQLDAWIDFGVDGSFAEPEDQIFASEPLAAGANSLSFMVPCTAAEGATFTRFRFSTAGGLSFDGPALDGEVEDHPITSDEVDFGDAPDTYSTTFDAGGPLHGLDPAADLYLGACVDSETDGQPNVGADGDDTNAGASELGSCAAGDDEDGVVFETMLIACQGAELTVTASSPGRLDAWIDLDGDGTFVGPFDQIFADEALGAGANTLLFDLPCEVAPGATYARFRVSSVGGLDFGGTTPDGEVEDYRVLVKGSDLGDAPDTYQTSFAENGPNHGVATNPPLHLGACVDTDIDGQPGVGADGDDLNVGTGSVGTCAADDDEDGVTFDTLLNVCLDAQITVTASAAGRLDSWIDFNGNGTFIGQDERITTGTILVPGQNTLTFTVPCTATPGETYARFRFSTDGVTTFSGPAMDGEVEDYAVTVRGFDFGDAPDLPYPTVFESNGARHIVQLTGNPVLGESVDIEANGMPSADHLGDDEDGIDDEDGVDFLDRDGLLIPGTDTDVEIRAGAVGGLLDAWIDWNRDGDWDDSEDRIASSVPIAANDSVVLTLAVPVAAAEGQSCARFRFSSAGGLGPRGMAMDGEVEDYEVFIGEEMPEIGLAKELLEVEKVDFNEFRVRFAMVLENLGNVPLDSVQIESDLATAFAEADSFVVDSVVSDDLTINPDFDGDADPFVLTGTDLLEIGGSGSVLMDLRVKPGSEPGPYLCSSLATGDSPGDMMVVDISQDGPETDPDDDGEADDNDDPTEILFDIVLIEIPTLGHLGLGLLALLLGLFGVRRVRRG